MSKSIVKKVRVWSKGQFTIPVEIREHLGIKEDSILNVIQIGNAFLVTPEQSFVKDLASSVQEKMADSNLSLQDLLCELRDGMRSSRFTGHN